MTEQEEHLERIATSVEGVELALNEIGVALNKLLDFISVVSFEDLEAQIEEKSEELIESDKEHFSECEITQRVGDE